MTTYSLYLTVDFYNDVKSIVNYVKKDSFANAKMLADEIKKSVVSLSEMPKMHQEAREIDKYEMLTGLDLRQIICKNHRIVYLIKDETVFVLGVFSCRQNSMEFTKISEYL